MGVLLFTNISCDRPFKPLLVCGTSNKTKVLEMYYILLIGACHTFRQNPPHLAIMLTKTPVQTNIAHSATTGSGSIRIVDKRLPFCLVFAIFFLHARTKIRHDLIAAYKLFRIPQSFRKT